MNKAVPIILTVAALLCSGYSVNWQGMGNLTRDNTTIIWTYINSQIQPWWTGRQLADNGDITLLNMATGLSNQLNELWAPAWNVVVISLISDGEFSDTIVYGYAFRDHWMWYNGIALNSGHFLTVILWKDYNCIKWWTFNKNDHPDWFTSSWDSATQTAMGGVVGANFDEKDIWQSAKTAVDNLLTSSDVGAKIPGDKAFTIIMSVSNMA